MMYFWMCFFFSFFYFIGMAQDKVEQHTTQVLMCGIPDNNL